MIIYWRLYFLSRSLYSSVILSMNDADGKEEVRVRGKRGAGKYPCTDLRLEGVCVCFDRKDLVGRWSRR